MIDKEIFKIASNTENFGLLDNYTHSSVLRNSICGDDFKIYLIIKQGIIKKIKYNGHSCIYCQASASLLSKTLKNKSTKNIKDFIIVSKSYFDSSKIIKNKNFHPFKKIFNKKNVARKNCLLLPLKTLEKALNN